MGGRREDSVRLSVYEILETTCFTIIQSERQEFYMKRKISRIFVILLCASMVLSNPFRAEASGKNETEISIQWTVPTQKQWSVTKAPYRNDLSPVTVSWNNYIASYYPTAAYLRIPSNLKKLNVYVAVYAKNANTSKYTLLTRSQIANWNVRIDSSSNFRFYSGNTYHFKIRLVKKTASGYTNLTGLSKVKTVSMLHYPRTFAAKQTGTAENPKVLLSWNKIAAAQGYYVYTDTIDGITSRTLIADVKGAGNTSLTVNVKNGHHYCFSIQSYDAHTKSSEKQVGIRIANLTNKESGSVKPAKSAKTESTAAKTGIKNGWVYENGMKYYYQNGQKLTDLRKKVKGPYQICVNRAASTTTVYAKDGKNGYIIPVVSFVCSAGSGTNSPIGTFKFTSKKRWLHFALWDSFVQYAIKFESGRYFHSLSYTSKSPYSLDPATYHALGKRASHGCIRFLAGDLKWMYKNMDSVESIRIYDSSVPGPYGKPKAPPIGKSEKGYYDPTDPAVK